MKRTISILLGLVLMAEAVLGDGHVVQAQTWDERAYVESAMEDDTQYTERITQEYEESVSECVTEKDAETAERESDTIDISEEDSMQENDNAGLSQEDTEDEAALETVTEQQIKTDAGTEENEESEETTYDGAEHNGVDNGYYSDSYKTGKYYQQLLAVPITGNQITDILAVAKSQVGYNQGADMTGNGTPTGSCTEYGWFHGASNNAWCAYFISWCARQAGIPTSVIPKASGAGGMRNGAGTYYDITSGVTPQAGDLILIEPYNNGYYEAPRLNNGVPTVSSHVGLVRYYSGGRVYTCEGNVDYNGDGKYRVQDTSRLWNGVRMNKDHVQGFVRPNYGSGSGSPGGEEVSISVKNTGVKDIGETTATISGQCIKSGSNVKLEQCGLYMGTSQSNMARINTESVSAAANAHNNGNSFDIWYNVEQELGYRLSAGTTYYYKFFCTYGGKEYCSEVGSFTTTGVNVRFLTNGPYFIAPYNVSFHAVCEKTLSDTKLLSIELYLGLNPNNMEKVGIHVFSSDENNNNIVEAYFNGVSVMPEKTYYCKYIVYSYDGKSYSSEVSSFTTSVNTVFLSGEDVSCNSEGTETNVLCRCEKAEKNQIYSIDFYLGTDKDHLALVKSCEITNEMNTVSAGGRGFTLQFTAKTQPNTKYYYQFKCVYDFGAKYASDINTFTTTCVNINLDTDHISWDTSNSDLTLTAVCDKNADAKPSSVELYMGTSKTGMVKKGAYNVSQKDNTEYENGKKFYPVFEVKGLDEAVTYYYQYRCTYNGKEYQSDILSLLTRRNAKIYNTGVIVHYAKDTLFDMVPKELRNCVDEALYTHGKQIVECDLKYNAFLELSNGEKRFQLIRSYVGTDITEEVWIIENPNLAVTYLATGGSVNIPAEITLKASQGDDYQSFQYTQSPEYANEKWTVERVDTGEEAAKIVLNSSGMAEGIQAVKAGENTFRIVNTQSNTSYVTFTVKVIGGEEESPDADDDDHYYHMAERIDLAALKETDYRISPIQPREYNGTPYTPSIKLSIYENGKWKTLTLGTDYRVSYQYNTNAGTDQNTAAAIVKGNGSYKGTLRAAFKITAKPISKLKFTACDMSIKDQAPKIYVYDGATLLKEGADWDYILEYDKNTLKSAGRKSITVKANNKNYQGSAEVKINVFDADNVIGAAEIELENDTYPYSYGKAIKPKVISVMADGKILDASKDYKVSYIGNKNAGTAYVVVTGKGQYAGRAVKAFSITSEESKLSIGGIKSVTFNGKAQKPAVAVTSAGRKLKAGKDYTVVYKNNVHAGTATVTVTGIGNYSLSGSASKAFTIKKQHIKKASVKVKQGKIFLTYGKSTLKEKSPYKDNDYELVYGEDFNGKVMVRIIGHGDFEFDVTKKVNIK